MVLVLKKECDECNCECEIAIMAGVEYDYESAPSILCQSCLEKALKLIVEEELRRRFEVKEDYFAS